MATCDASGMAIITPNVSQLGTWPPHSGNQIPEKHVPLPHISNYSVGDPLVIISWLTNHNRNPNTSLGIVTPPSGPLLKGLSLCKPNLDY